MYILFWVAVIMSGVTLVILMNNFLLFFVTLALGVVSIKGYVFTQKRKLRDRIKDQLGPALQTIGSSYQAQKNWLYALRSVTPMLQEPVKGEIERVQRQHETGMSITDAFKQMQKDLNLPELQLFITMVEISQQSGSEVAEGIITAGAYFQQRKIKMQELANAMMSGLSENRILTYVFIGIVVGFRLFKEDMFRGFTHTLFGQILLAFFMSIAVLCLFVSMKISRKEM
jgi:Flp pilus assembly protein TadB